MRAAAEHAEYVVLQYANLAARFRHRPRLSSPPMAGATMRDNRNRTLNRSLYNDFWASDSGRHLDRIDTDGAAWLR
jgi:hypothetical protein